MAKIERVLIWSGWLRLSHLLVGLSVLVLMATGWLLEMAPSVEAAAVDYHYLAAAILVVGLVLRLFLMFRGQRVEGISELMPEDTEWPAVLETGRFYVGFGKAPLPRWYAHNPLWKPLYLLLYILLLVLVLSGWLRSEHPLLMGIYLPNVHAVFATAVAWWTLLHILTAILHDYRGEAADVSSMINGHRLFVVDKPQPGQFGIQETTVHLDQIGRPPR